MAKLLEKLNEDIIKLTYEGNTVIKDVLKGLKCQLQLTQKKNGKDLTDEVEIDILKKEIKQYFPRALFDKIQVQNQQL